MNTYAPTYDATHTNVSAAVLAGIILGILVILFAVGTAASRWDTRRNRRHPDEEAAILVAKEWAKKQAPR